MKTAGKSHSFHIIQRSERRTIVHPMPRSSALHAWVPRYLKGYRGITAEVESRDETKNLIDLLAGINGLSRALFVDEITQLQSFPSLASLPTHSSAGFELIKVFWMGGT